MISSVRELEAFEATHGVSLPGDFKAYLLEIGTGGAYFMEGDVPAIQELSTEEIDRLKSLSP